MAIVAVAFNGTRLNSSDTNTGWGNYGSGGGTPASEAANAYQITTGAGANTGAVGKKVNSTAARIGVDYNGTAVDYTAAANRLWYVKIYVSDAFDLNTTWGAEISIGSSDTGNFHQYNVAGSGANLPVYSTWPAQGGYIITCIDPTIDTWAEVIDSGGITDQTALLWYAVGAQFQNGNAKSENVAMDAIDYGTGLTLTAGDGVSVDGKYTDFVAIDQGLITNRWGAAIGSGDNVIFRGIATIGSATATEFTDSTSIITFPDGYHSAGLFGIKVDIQNASTVVADGALIIGEGTLNGAIANDTRPDYIVSGIAGTYTYTGTMRNFRNVTFTSVCDVAGIIECELLTQGSANIENAVIRTNSITSIACLQDPTFGTSTDLNNTTFIQTGAGHAIELSTVGGTFTFTGLTFTGYGADTTDSAALDITAATGTTTINYSGTPPTYKTAGATVVLSASYDLTLTFIPPDVAVTIVLSSTRAELQHTVTVGGASVTAGSFVVGVQYTILTTGTTNFTLIGASDSLPGTTFVATGVGTGTGTAEPSVDVVYTHDGTETIDILLNSLKYDPNLSDIYDLALPTTNSSIKFQMLGDSNYSNPV